MKDKEKFRQQLMKFLADYERIINETDPTFRDFMREECSGSINSLKALIDSL